MKMLKVSAAFHDALDLLEYSSKNVFITGRAGTGKSTLLKLFRGSTSKKVVVLAPTGVAALNVQGQTIHSFCGFPPHIIRPEDVSVRNNKDAYKSIDVLVIDEISMVRADILDRMDQFFKINREKKDLPFGGLQVVMVGDLYQLPPIVAQRVEREYLAQYYDSPYFFSAQVFKSGFQLEYFELSKVYRQEQKYFLRLLDEVRTGHVDEATLEDLNTRFTTQDTVEGAIHLCATRAAAHRINRYHLDRLQTEIFTFLAQVTGNFNRRNAPVDDPLILKNGAQVMILKNDAQKRYVNGSLGKITKVTPDEIHVSLFNDDSWSQEVKVVRERWDMIKYEVDAKEGIKPKVVGTLTQFPLKLAWAITIHKSQGKTFDKVMIDLGRGAFDFGQTYVALSRCKTMEGLFLKNRLRLQDIMADEQVVDYYRMMQH